MRLRSRAELASVIAAAMLGCGGPRIHPRGERVLLRIHTETGARYRTTVRATPAGDAERTRTTSITETIVDAVDPSGVITLRSIALECFGSLCGASASEPARVQISTINSRGQVVDVPTDQPRSVLSRSEWPDPRVEVGDTWDTRSVSRFPPLAYSPSYSFCSAHWTLVAIEGDGAATVAVLENESVCEGEGGVESRTRARLRVSIADATVYDARIEAANAEGPPDVVDVHVQRAAP